MSEGRPDPPAWTRQDQARADSFEQQIAALQPLLPTDSHQDVIIVGFVQALRSLMVQRVAENPRDLDRYVDLLAWIMNQLYEVRH